ncbi:MAG: FAD-dependent oxidoreductase [Acetobacter sp.]|uniref:NAD(P)/FAD-dependent oxidoreductase n=1 Tax=Acetobacter sp. TaxID=440 RepID=UPI0039ECA854
MPKGKILVVGGGIAGMSCAWALNRRGFDVELFEQGEIPYNISSSYDEHRIIRHAYGEMEGYAYLMPQAFNVWDKIWQDLGARHFDPTPAIYFMRGESDWYPAVHRSLARMGVPCVDIPLSDVANLYPMLREDGLTRVVRTEGAGILFPIRILTDMAEYLPTRGVRFHPYSKVEEVDVKAGTVKTANGLYRGDKVVICAGAWVDRLVPGLRGIAVPSRQAVLFLSPPAEYATAWKNAPVLIDLGEDSGTYTLPGRPGTRLKIGDHQFSRSGDPDGNRTASAADIARLKEAAARAWKDFDHYTLLEQKACFYTVTADERFIVRPEGEKAWIISACSGHGFKLAPLMADRVAAAIAEEIDPAGVQAWATGRDIPGL